MFSIGQTALISMISHLIFIFITWKVMQAVKFDPLLRKGSVVEARIFLLFLAIVIGSAVSRFFLEFLQWSGDLIFLFN